MGVPAPPPRLTVRGRCELSRTDGLPLRNDVQPFVVLWGDVIARQPTGQVPPECSRVSPIYSDTGGPRYCCWSYADARLSLYTMGP